VGDTTNNWTGRLARLYADQSTSAAQAWRIAEWLVNLEPSPRPDEGRADGHPRPYLRRRT
jgi:hypothetical protein